MAYATAKMRLISGVPGQAFFLYQSTDAISTIVASGYFDDAVDEYNLSTGDIIAVGSGTAFAAAVDLLVATNTSGTVTVVNGT
jgi:hypothetical protein